MYATKAYTHTYSRTKYMKKQKPRCPYCNTYIRTIKRKDGQKITVDLRPVYYYYQPDGNYEIITPNGNRQKGVIVGDGREGFIEHKCKRTF